MSEADVLKVEIEIEIDSEIPLSEQIRDAIENELSQFLAYCEPVVQIDDGRYSIPEDSLEINELEFNEQTLKGWMTFSFGVDFYAGCKDMDSYDEHDSEVFHFVVNKVDRKIVFDEIKLPKPWLPDYELENY
jgi:hypothetical protein